jgi:hypothetical protein
LDSLRRLIAAGDPNSILLAENAIDEYWAATPVPARKSGLSYVRQIVVLFATPQVATNIVLLTS